MPDPRGLVDLRSDTVTRPTPAMRAAMAAAEVGDDCYGEDPTVARLQENAAALLGKEAGLFVPSGRMANLLALRVLARAGTEILCPARCHIRSFEDAAAPVIAGVQPHPLDDLHGRFVPESIDAAMADTREHLAAISIVTSENSHMASGGRVSSPNEVRAVADAAARHDLPLYCDGARIFNAAIALGVEPAELTAPVTAAMFCFSKGLCAPVGSMLVGPADMIAAARFERGRLGGGMRQAGVIAAAAEVALDTMIDRLADDHARARRLAELLHDRFKRSVDPERVVTNIVCVDATGMPAGFLAQLAARGILGGMLGAGTIRFVTHHDVDDADIDRFAAALDTIE
jgi:threonine aldolase